MHKRIGSRTVKFETCPKICGFASVVSRKESQGPLAQSFDIVNNDSTFGQETWEKSESVMQQQALLAALKKASLSMSELNFVLAGDLLNQCTASAYAHVETQVPFLGLYGACSTMAESLALGAMLTDAGYSQNCAAVVSSHFCSAERQYRFPLHYGGQRTPTAQWTVTGSGCAILTSDQAAKGPKITHTLIGEIVDMGITDVNNMGAAMAPAAYESINTFLKDTNSPPKSFDLIVTGDLGHVGGQLLKALFAQDGIDISDHYNDCGMMIFDSQSQDTHSGGSGCGCSASVLCGHILKEMQNKALNKVLFCATGALLSPTSVLQGSTIPGICHIVQIEN